MKIISDEYVYKKEVDWSLLMEGLTLPVDNQVIFGQVMGRFLQRGESKNITLYLGGNSYQAKIVNVNLNSKFNRKKDTYQIRYSKNGDLSKALQTYFVKSLNNDASNQIIVCPNHHSIIHDVDPVFNRNKLLYRYSNGYEEKIILNHHL